MKSCILHRLEDGHGGMGDALSCVICGYSKYPEVFSLLTIHYLAGRVRKYGGWDTWLKQKGKPNILRSDSDLPSQA